MASLASAADGRRDCECESPVAECLTNHYALNLGPYTLHRGGLQIRVRCPVCGTGRVLVISAGRIDRVTWYCHHTPPCGGTDIRRALIKAGVPAGCVPAGDGTERDVVAEAIDAICAGGPPARTVLRVLAILRGYERWPDGHELVGLADDARISRATAYRSREAAPLASPWNTSTYTASANANGQTQVSAGESRNRERLTSETSLTMRHANVSPVRQETANANTRGPRGLAQPKRDAILGRHRRGESQRRIAAAVGVSVSTVNKVIGRAARG
jgi:DNA-binding NarL/FixJ family response regulator